MDVSAATDRVGVLSAVGTGWVLELASGCEMDADVAKGSRAGIRVAAASSGADIAVGAVDSLHATNARKARYPIKSDTARRESLCSPRSPPIFIYLPPESAQDRSTVMETTRFVLSAQYLTILPVLRTLSVRSRQSPDFPGNIAATRISMLG